MANLGKGQSGAAPEAALFGPLRRRLTLWYCGVLAAALILFGVSVYVGVHHELLQPIDGRLATNARQVGRIWQRTPLTPCGPLARPLVRLRLRLAASPYWACFDQNGTLLRASPAARTVSAFTAPTFATAALHGGVTRGTINAGGDIGAVRVYALSVRGLMSGATLGVVQVGMRIQGELTALRLLLTFLLAAGALILVAAALGGLFLAERALAPARLAVARQQAFTSNAAHELRTPLTLLRADAEVLLRGRERLAPDDAALLEDIVAETAHMAVLAANMLTLARLDTGSLRLERDVVDLAEVAATVTRRAGALAMEQGIALHAEAACPVPVLGDRSLLEQCALILLDNAIKYNRPGGSVVVTARRDGARALLEVSDTGIGIPPEHLSRLGERFYRVDKARSREAGGAGLGLSIARGIAAQHGGTLTLTSAPGQGSTATLALPHARQTPSASRTLRSRC